jgi:hypothetical protein
MFQPFSREPLQGINDFLIFGKRELRSDKKRFDFL